MQHRGERGHVLGRLAAVVRAGEGSQLGRVCRRESHRIVIDRAVNVPTVMQSLESRRQPGGVGQEFLDRHRLTCSEPVGDRHAPSPFADHPRVGSISAGGVYLRQVGMSDAGKGFDIRQKLFPTAGSDFGSKQPYQDRAVQGRIARQPLLYVAITTESDL